jgi:hypothetical protein
MSTKQQIRDELNAAVESFLKSGGSVVVEKSQKTPRVKSRAKGSRNTIKGGDMPARPKSIIKQMLEMA